jgi:hypothetical protein
MIRELGVGFALLLFVVPSYAQNTGGVFPPMVNEGHKAFQYRGVVNPDNSVGEFGFAQRFHYEESLDDDRMWRVIGQTRKTTVSDFDFDFIQAELFREFSEDDPNYRTGMRFDVRVRDRDRPNQLGVNWMNQFYFNNDWNARAVFMTSFDVGDNARDGLNLQSRFRLDKNIGAGRTLGVEMFNDYGRTNNIGSFNEQRHTIGPIYNTKLGSMWSAFSGVLFGVSEAAADTEFRLWLTRPM